MTSGAPIMSSQKIGPSSLASRVRSCTGAAESSDSMLPTTGMAGGCGIGLNLLLEAILIFPPLTCHSGARAQRANPESRDSGFGPSDRPGMTTSWLAKPPPAPFDQLGGNLL